MTVATDDRLEDVFSLLKTHEKSLESVAWSGHRVESDIFCELLSEVRAMALELEAVLKERRITVDQIKVAQPDKPITPGGLIAQREAFRKAYEKAISEYTTHSDVRNVLETHLSRLTGAGQEKLEILSAAVISGQ